MQLSARQYGGENIFAQSMAEMSYRKSRMLASTGASNLNHSMHSARLPQLSRSFSSSKSAKLKLATLEGALSALDQQLHELRLETRVTLPPFRSRGGTAISSRTTSPKTAWGCSGWS